MPNVCSDVRTMSNQVERRSQSTGRPKTTPHMVLLQLNSPARAPHHALGKIRRPHLAASRQPLRHGLLATRKKLEQGGSDCVIASTLTLILGNLNYGEFSLNPTTNVLTWRHRPLSSLLRFLT